MSDSLWSHGLQPARLLCPWDSPGKNTGVGCHFLLQGDLRNPGMGPMSPVSPALASGFFTDWTTRETQLANRWGSNLNQARLKILVSNISLWCCLNSSRTPLSPHHPHPQEARGTTFGIRSLAVATPGFRRGRGRYFPRWGASSQLRASPLGRGQLRP